MLWRKIAPRLSAGRVQSVATRLIVERERERMAFRSATWWDARGDARVRGAALPGRRSIALDGKTLALGRDFGPNGKLAAGHRKVVVLDEAAAAKLADGPHRPHRARAQGGGEGVHVLAQGAVHDLDACSRRRAASWA